LISAHRKILASFCYTNVIADYTPPSQSPLPPKKNYTEHISLEKHTMHFKKPGAKNSFPIGNNMVQCGSIPDR